MELSGGTQEILVLQERLMQVSEEIKQEINRAQLLIADLQKEVQRQDQMGSRYHDRYQALQILVFQIERIKNAGEILNLVVKEMQLWRDATQQREQRHHWG
jgi:hypothetical protein